MLWNSRKRIKINLKDKSKMVSKEDKGWQEIDIQEHVIVVANMYPLGSGILSDTEVIGELNA